MCGQCEFSMEFSPLNPCVNIATPGFTGSSYSHSTQGGGIRSDGSANLIDCNIHNNMASNVSLLCSN